jgi:hypothetical protein
MDDRPRAERQIAEHPGYRRHLDLQAFHLSIAAVFRSNFLELHGLLREAASDPTLAMELVQNVHEDSVRRDFQAETVRRLHNYLAATMSLVEHARRLMRSASRERVAISDDRKSKLLSHPEVGLMMDLRAFTQHRVLPELFHHLKIGGAGDPDVFESEVGLTTVALLDGDRWSPASRTYLQAHGDYLHLLPLVEVHAALVYEYNVWLHKGVVRRQQGRARRSQ